MYTIKFFFSSSCQQAPLFLFDWVGTSLAEVPGVRTKGCKRKEAFLRKLQQFLNFVQLINPYKHAYS